MTPSAKQRFWWSLVTVRDFGQGRRQAAALQAQSANELNGVDGTPHYGMKGSPSEQSYTGLVASPQTFIGAAQMGAAYNPVIQDYPALPADQAPPGLAAWVQNFDAMQSEL